MTCRCHSYNRADGETPAVILPTPDFIREASPGMSETFCVDACIADVVRAMHSRRIVTLSSCCGHGLSRPSIVLGDHDDVPAVYRVLDEIDGRDWKLYQWRNVVIGRDGRVTHGARDEKPWSDELKPSLTTGTWAWACEMALAGKVAHRWNVATELNRLSLVNGMLRFEFMTHHGRWVPGEAPEEDLTATDWEIAK